MHLWLHMFLFVSIIGDCLFGSRNAVVVWLWPMEGSMRNGLFRPSGMRMSTKENQKLLLSACNPYSSFSWSRWWAYKERFLRGSNRPSESCPEEYFCFFFPAGDGSNALLPFNLTVGCGYRSSFSYADILVLVIFGAIVLENIFWENNFLV